MCVCTGIYRHFCTCTHEQKREHSLINTLTNTHIHVRTHMYIHMYLRILQSQDSAETIVGGSKTEGALLMMIANSFNVDYAVLRASSFDTRRGDRLFTFSSARKRMSVLLVNGKRKSGMSYTKGAAEVILACSTRYYCHPHCTTLYSTLLYSTLLYSTLLCITFSHTNFSSNLPSLSHFSRFRLFYTFFSYLLSFLILRYMDSEGRVKMLTAAIRAELLATIDSMAKVRYDLCVWYDMMCM